MNRNHTRWVFHTTTRKRSEKELITEGNTLWNTLDQRCKACIITMQTSEDVDEGQILAWNGYFELWEAKDFVWVKQVLWPFEYAVPWRAAPKLAWRNMLSPDRNHWRTWEKGAPMDDD